MSIFHLTRRVVSVPMVSLRSRRTVAVMVMAILPSLVGIQIATAAESGASTVPSWTVESTPDLATSGELLSVACPASGTCMAVGFTSDAQGDQETLIESLINGTWTIMPSPNTASSINVLYSVSCGAVGECVAVGMSSTDVGPTADQTLIETLSDGTWSITPSADSGENGNQLNGVSCTGPGDCIAVGTSGYGNIDTLIDVDSGGSWSISATGTGAPGSLSGVSCASAGSCVAVGSVYAALSGGTWTVGNYVAPGDDSQLNGISCTTGGCIAVGEYYSSPDYEQWSTLIESYTGGAWNVMTSPNEGTDSYLDNVACTDPSDCTAVGYSLNTPIYPNVSSSLVTDLSNGQWTVVTSPNPQGTTGNAINRLEGVSCLAIDACDAIGWVAPNGGTVAQPLAMSSTPAPVTPPTPAPVTPPTPAPVTPPTPAPVTPPAPAPAASPHGYWLVGSDGGIFSFGSAQFYGSTGALKLQRPVVGITPTADDGGYWLVASDGGVFSFGDTQFYGSIPGLGLHPAGSGLPHSLNAPIVGIVPTVDDRGYFMVASDGGVFTFGDAKFEGSCPGIGGCAGAAVAVMPDASGNGYWLVTATGHVYAFGHAQNYGAPGPQAVPVTSAVRTTDGKGYWILFSDGVVAPYGDAQNLGGPSGVGGSNPATAIFTTSDGGGYWVASANGTVFTLGDATSYGSMASTHLNGSIIAATGW